MQGRGPRIFIARFLIADFHFAYCETRSNSLRNPDCMRRLAASHMRFGVRKKRLFSSEKHLSFSLNAGCLPRTFQILPDH